ncbi:MAG: endonuclease/exonuclease/phosphatase (EEP) superfamily protein YafD [Phycisphaerales bacterium]|jgi:endonuclease/exonuclease/phosphatase (EEP) superfamily protein YafD
MPQQKHSKFDSILFLALCVVAICANIGVLAGIVPQFDLFIHFQVQYLVLFLLLSVCFLCRRRWSFLAVSLFCTILPAMKVLPWYFGDVLDSTPQIRILSSNVKATNTDTPAILKMIDDVHADIVVLLEATELHSYELEDLKYDYPFVYSAELHGGSGFLLYSKFLLTNVAFPDTGVGGMVSAFATVRSPFGDFDILAIHPIRPGLRHGSRLRDIAIKNITAHLKIASETTVVIGDLNTTMWTGSYNRFVQENGLHNLREGRGVMPSWGMQNLGRFVSIPIDHCFVRGDIRGASFELLSLDGSDHEAIVAGLTFE